FFPPFHLLSSPLQYKLQFVGILLFIILGGVKGCSGAEDVTTLAQSLGHMSEAHLNSALALDLLVSCQISMLGAGAASAIMRRSKESSFFIISKNFSCNINHYNHSDYKVTFSQITNHCLHNSFIHAKATYFQTTDVTYLIPLTCVKISFIGCGIIPARSFGPALINVADLFFHSGCTGFGQCVAKTLIYDFLVYPRTHNFCACRNILDNGPKSENDAVEITGEGNRNPGLSQWLKQ
uniref:Uncharacterized protein n=1 Tax=Sander lucioperca TaxID=283035 RepID=A0A8C9ZQ91_SANLU